MALTNQAHFGEETGRKSELEIEVKAGNLAALSAGPQGNAADGNERGYMDGHARALLLAREAYVLRGPSDTHTSPEAVAASGDAYGHETQPQQTGLIDPAAGAKSLQLLPQGADGKPLQRSSNVATLKSKLNDAYVENAGADHYLTDAFAAGHQIVREVIGTVAGKFVAEKGGRDKFLSFVVSRIQEGAKRDPESVKGELGEFQSASRTWKDKAARGESWLNSKYSPTRWVGLSGDGLKQKLEAKIDDGKLRSIGAKVVHDYYNRNGLIVHNEKGMTFVIKGDGHASEAPEARQVIALAVLESRNQITETAKTGTSANPMAVWEYSPSLDKTTFTETSGMKAMEVMFADGDYLWGMIKENFSAADKPSTDQEQAQSANDPTQKAIARTPADVGAALMRGWFEQRQAFVQAQVGKHQERPEHGANPVTADGVTLPRRGG